MSRKLLLDCLLIGLMMVISVGLGRLIFLILQGVIPIAPGLALVGILAYIIVAILVYI